MSAIPPSSPPPALILNVDDTEAARYVKSRTLRHAGFEVAEAASGAEALRLVEALSPVLVLLDMRLPDVSGIEVCRAIKQRWPATMVLQTSAVLVSAADRARGLEGGADAYLTQPIDPQELVASVRALLRLHAAESGLRALNEGLERRVHERTQALRDANVRLVEQIAQRERAEAALVQAQKMEVIGQLAGSMAHDFNNILASMAGYIHVVQRLSTEPQLQGYLAKALDAAERGKRLTQRLLAFSRSNELVAEPTDVRALLAGMRDWLEQAVDRAIPIELSLPEGPLLAVTDPHQLELAVLNLVINARDAMPQGGCIRISAAVQDMPAADGALAPGRYVALEVNDDGTGMPAEVAAQAFDPFFTTKPVGQGTGLGLAQVANVARMSCGAACIDSAPGRGTRVLLWLRAGEDEGAAPSEPATGGAAALPPGRGERVLVVDDEGDIRDTLSALLQEHGYVVQVASDAATALEAVRAHEPQIALLDIALPGELDGLGLAAELRRAHPALPLVFVSGHAGREAVAQVVGARLLNKPFRSAELLQAVRGALDAGVPTQAVA